MWIDHILFINPSAGRYLCAFWLLMNNAAMNIYVHVLYEYMNSVLLGINLGVELLSRSYVTL